KEKTYVQGDHSLTGGNSNLNVGQAFQPANFLSAISAGWKACPTGVNSCPNDLPVFRVCDDHQDEIYVFVG
ncbi:MAG: hypothetical protein V2B18_00335, partial [Pseudomonadota bacterium]